MYYRYIEYVYYVCMKYIHVYKSINIYICMFIYIIYLYVSTKIHYIDIEQALGHCNLICKVPLRNTN